MINGSRQALSGPEPTIKLNGTCWKNTLKTVPIWKYAKPTKLPYFVDQTVLANLIVQKIIKF